jgi:3-oxoacid CoA-transferase subunit B
MAVISLTPEGLVLEQVAPDMTVEEVRKATEPELIVRPGGPAKMSVPV